MASSTRFRVSGATMSGRCRVRETVATDVLAAAATSRMLYLRPTGRGLSIRLRRTVFLFSLC